MVRNSLRKKNKITTILKIAHFDSIDSVVITSSVSNFQSLPTADDDSFICLVETSGIKNYGFIFYLQTDCVSMKNRKSMFFQLTHFVSCICF